MSFFDDVNEEARWDRHNFDDRWPSEYGDAESDAMHPTRVTPTQEQEALIAACFGPFHRDHEKPGADETHADYEYAEALDRLDEANRTAPAERAA